MAAEIGEADDVFASAAGQMLKVPALGSTRAIYTIARGSSDAAANILSYEFMRELGLPMTSLPPSVFSIGTGVDMTDALALVVSQSGASDDLVRAARGIRAKGGRVIAITNEPGSPVEAAANMTVAIGAGPERAVPATKTVIGSIGAGLALLAALKPDYRVRLNQAVGGIIRPSGPPRKIRPQLTQALLRSRHVYVIGRDTGFGAAHELALKIKETCAIHAEAYSASEVLHGPMQLATSGLLVIVLNTMADGTGQSLDTAEAKLRQHGAEVIRVTPTNEEPTPATAAATLLRLIYPAVLDTALALGHDPDAPSTLAKVTHTI